MSNEIVIAIIGSLGLGSIITSLISQLINKNNSAQESRKAKMRERYLAIMILMFARLNPDKENYLKVALEMRKDLWGSKNRITIKDLGNM